MHAIEVPVAPSPIAVARRLLRAGGTSLALLHTAARDDRAPLGVGRWSFAAVDPDLRSAALDPMDDDPLPRAVGPLARVPRWIGAVPYEARRSSLERGASGRDARPPA